MEEIGCHFKFEKIIGNIYHDTNLLLSSGRNCLKYIINERNITTLFLPYFLCESLSEVAISENVKIEFYHIDNNFMPLDIDENKLNDTTYIYFVNYYGLFKDNIQKIIDKYRTKSQDCAIISFKNKCIEVKHETYIGNIFNYMTLRPYTEVYDLDGSNWNGKSPMWELFEKIIF